MSVVGCEGMSKDEIVIRNKVREHREKRGFTIAQLAELVNVSESTIKSLENNTSNTGLKTICAIARVFGEELSNVFFFGEAGPEKAHKQVTFDDYDFQDTVTIRLLEMLKEREEQGLETYGETLADAPDENYDWRIMMIEELIDSHKYAIKEIIRLERLINTLEKK